MNLGVSPVVLGLEGAPGQLWAPCPAEGLWSDSDRTTPFPALSPRFNPSWPPGGVFLALP